ncbi:MAG: DUF6932 family protein [Rhabdochlamydiaceae bacterium]
MLAPFDSDGNLPEGIHWATWSEICERFGKTKRRRELLVGLKAALLSLKGAGCRVVYVDGSFATSKENPRDFDCCWEPEGVDVGRLDKVFLHTNRQGRLAQKMRYGGEFFLTDAPELGSKTTFFRFFQKDRDGNSKGILGIKLEGLQ